MKKILLVIASLLIIASMLLTACGAPATPAPAAPKATEASAAKAPAAATAAPAATTKTAEPTKAAAPAEKPKMTVWLGTSFTPEADALNKVNIEAWAKAKGVDVTLVQEQCTVIQTQLNAAIESKALPDVVSWCLPDMGPSWRGWGCR